MDLIPEKDWINKEARERAQQEEEAEKKENESVDGGDMESRNKGKTPEEPKDKGVPDPE